MYDCVEGHRKFYARRREPWGIQQYERALVRRWSLRMRRWLLRTFVRSCCAQVTNLSVWRAR